MLRHLLILALIAWTIAWLALGASILHAALTAV